MRTRHLREWPCFFCCSQRRQKRKLRFGSSPKAKQPNTLESCDTSAHNQHYGAPLSIWLTIRPPHAVRLQMGELALKESLLETAKSTISKLQEENSSLEQVRA
jgi:hypothetical protein